MLLKTQSVLMLLADSWHLLPSQHFAAVKHLLRSCFWLLIVVQHFRSLEWCVWYDEPPLSQHQLGLLVSHLIWGLCFTGHFVPEVLVLGFTSFWLSWLFTLGLLALHLQLGDSECWLCIAVDAKSSFDFGVCLDSSNSLDGSTRLGVS